MYSDSRNKTISYKSIQVKKFLSTDISNGGRQLRNIDDTVDSPFVMLTIVMKRMILVRTQQSWLGLDRIDSVPGHHSLIITSNEIDSLHALLLYIKVPVELRLVLRVINRDSTG